MNDLKKISTSYKARVGIYTGGLKAYWSQFDGLKQRLISYGKFIEKKMSLWGEIYNFGLVDDEVSGRRAGEYFNANNVDIIFCHSATYFTSACMIPIHQICKVPVIILNLQPTASMNYEKTTTGEWLSHCTSCPVPEITNVLQRAHVRVKIINGLLGLDKSPTVSLTDEITEHRTEAINAWKEIGEWITASTVCRTLQHARFGFLGNNYSGMLDMYSDFTMIQAQMGIHIEILEMCDLYRFISTVTDDEIHEKIHCINTFFEISGDSPSEPIAKTPTKEQMNWSAKIAVAQEKFVKAYDLDALAYYYHGNNNEYEKVQSGFVVGHSLLTAQGVPCAGEGDLKTALAMKMCDVINVGGSFCEIVTIDYDRKTIILGHDGPFHIKIARQKPLLRGMEIYHGKKGAGVSVEANVIEGDITTLGIFQTYKGNLKMIINEGRAVEAPIAMIGNTQTHVDFGEHPDIYMDKLFVESPTHHCAMAVGHQSAVLKKIAYLKGIEYVVV